MNCHNMQMAAVIICLAGTCSQLFASASDELMKSVRELRAATLAAAPAGHGDVVMERQHTVHGDVRDVPRHRAEFRFVGPDNLLVEYKPDGKAVMQSTLSTEATVTRFVGSGSPVPTHVSVKPREWSPVVDLQGFSFMDLAAIPIPGGASESRYFSRSFDNKQINVERVGNQVRVHELYFAPAGVKDMVSDEYLNEFDMVHGGMLVRSRHVWKGRIGGQDPIMVEADERVWTWAREDGHVVPTKFVRDQVSTKETEAVQKSHSVVEFSKFERDGASAIKPTIDDMQIVPGSKVADTVRGLSWEYFLGAAQMQMDPATLSPDLKERR